MKYPVSLLIRLLEINPSSYYKWLKRKDTPNQYERFRIELTSILKQKSQQHKTWGYHRLATAVRRESQLVFSDLLAHKCCKEAGIRSKARPYHYRKAGEEHIRFPNSVKGHWDACEPMALVVSDMTCLMNKGVRYEWTILLDTFNNEILAHALSRNGNAAPYYDCLETLKQKSLQLNRTVTLHTDQGSVYSSRSFQLSHDGYPILRSMSRVGTPTDNPVIEALNGWMKSELYLEYNLHSTDDLLGTLDRYVSFFNHERPASALNYKSPVQFRLDQGFL